MKQTILVILYTCTLLSPSAWACRWDTDCAVGSRCLKEQPLDRFGVCAGGLRPGNRDDQVPVFRPQSKQKTGESCRFDTDCGIGGQCYKENFSPKGVCI